jgi:predicted DNA binding CopG/RHH family protein
VRQQQIQDYSHERLLNVYQSDVLKKKHNAVNPTLPNDIFAVKYYANNSSEKFIFHFM